MRRHSAVGVFMMGWNCDRPGWGGHWFGGILVPLFWFLVIAGIAALVRGVLSRNGGESPVAHDSPLEIPNRCYAKGVINKAEFEEKRKDILGS